MEERIKQAEILFKKIDAELSPKFKGKLVAIEPESKDYFIGDNGLEACKKAAEKHPNRKFVLKRIGFDYTYFVGAQ